MAENKKLYQSRKHRSVLFGILLGFLFIAVSLSIRIITQELTLSIENIIKIHQQHNLIWVIELAPLVLGLYGWIVGRYEHSISVVTSELSTLSDDYSDSLRNNHMLEIEKEVILNSVTENVSFHDTDLKTIWVNNSVVKSSGMTREQLIGSHCHNTWHDSKNPCQNCPLSKALKTGKSHETKISTSDGKHLLIKGFPVFGDNKEIIGVVEVAKDITAEVSFEQRIQASEEKYRNVVERANDGIAIIQDCVFKYVNPKCLDLFGYNESEMVGNQFVDFVCRDELNRLGEDYYNQIPSGNISEVYESRLLHKNGNPVHVEINSGLINYEGKEANLVFIRDISERKQAETVLREAEERYHDLVENINEVLYLFNADGIIEYISPAMKYIAEYIPIEMVDKNINEFIFHDDLENFNKSINSVLAGNPEVFECRMITRSSAVRWLRISAKPTYGEDTIIGIQGLMIDITNQRAAEEALYESEKRYRAVSEVTTDYAYLYKVDDNGELHLDWITGAVQRISGYSSDEIINMGGFLSSMVHPDDTDKTNLRAEKLLDNKKDTSIIRIITKSGELKYISHIGRPIWDSKKKRVVEIIGAGKDITEQVEAGIAIKESEEMFRAITSTANDAIIMTNQNGEISFWNEMAETIFEYKKSEVMGEILHEIIAPDEYMESYRQTFPYFQESGKEIAFGKTIELEALRKDGSRFSAELSLSSLQLKNQWHSVSIIRDITERKKADEARLSDERRLKVLNHLHQMQNSPEKEIADFALENSVFITDSEIGYLAFLSDDESQLSMYCWSIQSLGKDKISDKHATYPIDKVGLWNELVQHRKPIIINDNKSANNHEQGFPDEQINITSHLGIPLIEGNRVVAIAVLGNKTDDYNDTDIHQFASLIHGMWGIIQRKKAKDQLRESRQMLQLVLDNIPQRIFWKNRKSIYIGCNKQFARDAGVADTFEITQKSDYDLPSRKRHAEMSIKDDQYVIENNKPKYSIIEKLTKPDGGITWLETNKVPLHDSDGNVVGLLGTYEDITERKLADKKNKHLQEKLEKAKRMESLGLLAGGIAHDLNNTLSPLVGYSDLILGDLPKSDPMRKKIEHIYRASQDAADVIQDLVTMARRGRYEMSPINLTEVVKLYLESPGYFHKKGIHSNIQVELKLDSNIPNIIGSTPHLIKVVMNLIVNAFDAMPDGGGLTIETSKIYLSKLLSGHSRLKEDDYIVLKVSDSGSGIAPDDQKKIFEPYYSKKKLGSSGSGLGLAVVYGIIKDHNGYYDIVSALGEGATFILYFPVTRKEIEIQDDENQQDLSGSESLLVVEDSHEQRHLTVELLKTFGYTVESVENGHEAVKYISQNKTDIVVLDMIMERDYDGLDTYQDILKINPQQKVLIVSGYSTSQRVNKMLEMGAGLFLKKPFTRDKIGAAVRQVLDSSPQKPELVKT